MSVKTHEEFKQHLRSELRSSMMWVMCMGALVRDAGPAGAREFFEKAVDNYVNQWRKNSQEALGKKNCSVEDIKQYLLYIDRTANEIKSEMMAEVEATIKANGG